jgi:hypothetical protein
VWFGILDYASQDIAFLIQVPVLLCFVTIRSWISEVCFCQACILWHCIGCEFCSIPLFQIKGWFIGISDHDIVLLMCMFSSSWGYKKVFEQFAYAIQQKYPELIIHGDVYPPATVNTFLAHALSIAKMIFMVLIVSGQNPFTWLQVETPSVYTWALENKVCGTSWYFKFQLVLACLCIWSPRLDFVITH